MKKKIAVVGAGFSGLALCYYLLQYGGGVTLFDGKGIGGGASGIASGLLHPYPGENCLLSWKGEEGMEKTKKLLKLVGPHVYKETGILRLATSEKQEKVFKERAREREDIEWWEEEKCRQFVPGSHFLPGIFIRSGITVHASLYLKGLWKVCEEKGASFVKKEVFLPELDSFDYVILAVGGGIRSFDVGNALDLKFNKGQILVCQRPHYLKEESSVIGKGYIALSESKERCYLGSTYERDYVTEKPCLGVATDRILDQIGQFMAATNPFKVLGCFSEMRVANGKTYHPIAKKVSDKVFVLTGMGSRGLLYHSYLGEKLAQEVLL
ncbi:MAG: FAD-dependent oxidoreductase [Chlamydiia bacterium]|nr:FAD-dependent oxidoreductase [Chlamydiia bacterium]